MSEVSTTGTRGYRQRNNMIWFFDLFQVVAFMPFLASGFFLGTLAQAFRLGFSQSIRRGWFAAVAAIFVDFLFQFGNTFWLRGVSCSLVNITNVPDIKFAGSLESKDTDKCLLQGLRGYYNDLVAIVLLSGQHRPN